MTFDGRGPGTGSARWAADPRLARLDALRRPGGGRTVVVAAHPDDETLGAGGLLAELAAAGTPAEVVVVTDGAASHPGSPTLGSDRLRRLRADELRRAVALLSPESVVTLLGHSDGEVREHRDAVTADLRAVLTADESPTLVVAPWRGDGHRDHREVGEICAGLAAEIGARLIEYPVWLWHWADPDDPRVPWANLRVLPLSDRSVVLKHRAIAAHTTQVQPVSLDPADTPPLHPDFVRVFDRDTEVFVASDDPPAADLPAAFFDASYERRPDPWGLGSRWYERRKRAVTLAALPDERYRDVLEVGCSIGMLTAELADRCDRLVATDVSPAALAQAKERSAHRSNVDLVQHDIGEGVPGGPYDLVVLSEVGYYLTRPHLLDLAQSVRGALTSRGTVVACHWRHPVAEYPLGGDDVHHALAAGLGLARLVRHVEEDFVLEVWSRDPRSVGRRTGLA